MSVIEATNPLSSASSTQGASRIREFRQWLYDAWGAYARRHQDGTTPFDPGTTPGQFGLPFSAPGAPTAGDLYLTTTGLLVFYRASVSSRVAGTLESGTKKFFRQASAPAGWTRDTSFSNGSTLTYLPSGVPSAGNADDISSAHPITTTSIGGGAFHDFWRTSLTHPLKYQDVLLATKD